MLVEDIANDEDPEATNQTAINSGLVEDFADVTKAFKEAGERLKQRVQQEIVMRQKEIDAEAAKLPDDTSGGSAQGMGRWAAHRAKRTR